MNQNMEFAKVGLGAAVTLILAYDVFLKPEPKVRYVGGEPTANTQARTIPSGQNNQNAQFNDQGAATTLDPNNIPIQQNQSNVAPQPTGPTTVMTFPQSHHDFGTIKQNTENEYKFAFTNDGENPLIIQEASGSCGCTVPEYPKEPIPPGGSGEITVKYSPGLQEGQQNKTVTLVANTQPSTKYLTIAAVVEKE